MRYSTVIASAISAAAVLAAPVEKRALVTSWVIDIVTETTTIYPDATPSPAPQPSPIAALGIGGSGGYHSHSQPAPAPTTSSVVVVPLPEPITTPVPISVAPTTSAAPAPTTSSAPSGGNSTPGSCSAWTQNNDWNSPDVDCGVSVLDTMNKWRKWYNLPELEWSSDLAQAAWNTVYNDHGGPDMNHDLSHGSMGEIISPGFWNSADLHSDQKAAMPADFTPFDLAMAGWLCEVPTDPQLQASGPTGVNLCGSKGTVSQTTYISGSANAKEPTGHHDIIVTASYTKTACKYMDSTSPDASQPQWAGQWVCEFA